MKYQGMTALITGASMGLGEAFARELAKRGVDLVVVARSEDKLNSLAKTLRKDANIEVTALPADLSSAEALARLIAEIQSRNLHIDLLINNAGLGVFDDFLDTPLTKQLEQVDVNMRALVALTGAFVPGMVAAQRGGVINLASTAAPTARRCNSVFGFQSVRSFL